MLGADGRFAVLWLGHDALAIPVDLDPAAAAEQLVRERDADVERIGQGRRQQPPGRVQQVHVGTRGQGRAARHDAARLQQGQVEALAVEAHEHLRRAETLADEACIAVLRKLEKQRKESIEAYEQAGREDRASAERAELAVVQEFLPALADEETTRGWVSAAIEQTGASGKGDLGKVMGAVMKAHKGDVDGNLARALASELLGG